MSFYSKPIAYIAILAISGFALPVAKADEAKISQSATKISIEPQQNPSSATPSVPVTTDTLAEKFVTDATSSPLVTVFTPETIQWQAGSDLLPVGSKVAILEGDPAKEGPFTMRVKFPANYMVAPHTHSSLERMTVVSGTFNLGIGQKFDATKGTVMPVGSFVVIQAGLSHYGWGTEETVLQIQGIGPRVQVFVEPVPVTPPTKTSY